MSFLTLRVRTPTVLHGDDSENKELLEDAQEEPFVEKVIAVSRIQSISDKYILVTSSHGGVMSWEYEGGLGALKDRLAQAGHWFHEWSLDRHA